MDEFEALGIDPGVAAAVLLGAFVRELKEALGLSEDDDPSFGEIIDMSVEAITNYRDLQNS